MLGNLINIGKNLINPVKGLIDEIFTSDEEKMNFKVKLLELENDLNKVVIEAENKLIEAKRDILVAELKGDLWIQKAWRPLLMMTIIAIVANNYLVFPLLGIFFEKVQMIDLPDKLWNLLVVGVGGYIASRGFEKVKGVKK